VNERYRLIQQLASAHPIAMLCVMLEVSSSGYYGWRTRVPCRRQREDAQLTVELHAVFEQSRRTYGRPRLTRALRIAGHVHGQRRIGRLMRAAGLCARPRRRFRPQTTQSKHNGPIAPNRLAQRSGPPTGPDQVWAVDITYLPTTEGWLFLAIVLDLYSRRIVGWAFDSSMPTALPLAALQMALHQRRPAPGLLHHSDLGCQYASEQYRRLLQCHGLQASMSRTGNPYDNASVESFFSTFKTECLRPSELSSPKLTKAIAFDYIESFYNTTRLHSSIDYQSPVDFEAAIH
jgi:transposase InsO family protein